MSKASQITVTGEQRGTNRRKFLSYLGSAPTIAASGRILIANNDLDLVGGKESDAVLGITAFSAGQAPAEKWTCTSPETGYGT